MYGQIVSTHPLAFGNDLGRVSLLAEIEVKVNDRKLLCNIVNHS